MTVRELSNIVFGKDKHGTIVALRAYFDASGKEEDPIVTVAGYAATDALCEKIEDQWNDATKGRLFHLTDFGTPQCELGSADWTAHERAKFLCRLGSIVNQRGIHVVSISVETSVYREVVAESSNQFVFGPPFSGCAQLCNSVVELMADHAKRSSEHIAVVFEKGDREHELHKGFSDAQKVDPKHKDLRSLAFLPKRTTLLQPADLIAGKVREVLNRARRHGPLDNGDQVTQVTSFATHYSSNGTSASILKRNVGTGVPFCYVANRKLLQSADLNFMRLFREQPRTLARYTKDIRNQGKRSKLKP